MKSFRNNTASRLQKAGKFVLTKQVRGALLRLPLLPRAVARVLDDIRFVEPDVLRFIRNTVQPGWCCVDVGAHCGTVSIRMARLVGSEGCVLAIEPIAENAMLLERNLRERRLLSRCIIVRSAVGAQEGRFGMTRGNHSTTWRFTFPTDEQAESQQVDVSRLDSLLETRSAVHLVKVDIEGAEVDLVAGAEHTISRLRPLWLFEMHGPDSWAISGEFLRQRYRVFHLDGSEITSAADDTLRYGHAVFCPIEKISLLG